MAQKPPDKPEQPRLKRLRKLGRFLPALTIQRKPDGKFKSVWFRWNWKF